MFLDEAIWRIKYRKFPDRVEFLVQLNAHNQQDDVGGFGPDFTEGQTAYAENKTTSN